MSTKDWLEKDYYKILGVPKDADAATVKKAYRTLARDLHPDRNASDKAAETRFKEVSEAYSVLSNPERRKEYDEARTLFGSGFRVPTGAGRGGSTGGSFNFDLGDLFGGTPGGQSGGGIGDVFGGLFGQRTRTTQPRRGADVESEVTIGFREAVDGVTVPLRMTSASACTACAGPGTRAPTPVASRCPSRAGTARAEGSSSTTPVRSATAPAAGPPAGSCRSASRPGFATGSGSASRERARRASAAGRRATSTSSCMCRRTRCSGGAANT